MLTKHIVGTYVIIVNCYEDPPNARLALALKFPFKDDLFNLVKLILNAYDSFFHQLSQNRTADCLLILHFGRTFPIKIVFGLGFKSVP